MKHKKGGTQLDSQIPGELAGMAALGISVLCSDFNIVPPAELGQDDTPSTESPFAEIFLFEAGLERTETQ